MCLLGDILDHPPCERSSTRNKFAERVGDHVVLSPTGAVLVTLPGAESSTPPHPLQSLNDSCVSIAVRPPAYVVG